MTGAIHISEVAGDGSATLCGAPAPQTRVLLRLTERNRSSATCAGCLRAAAAAPHCSADGCLHPVSHRRIVGGSPMCALHLAQAEHQDGTPATRRAAVMAGLAQSAGLPDAADAVRSLTVGGRRLEIDSHD